MKKLQGRHQAADMFALDEAYDRLDMMSRMVDTFLVHHPGVVSVPGAAKKVASALTSLGAAHDEIAAVQLLQELGPLKKASKTRQADHPRHR